MQALGGMAEDETFAPPLFFFLLLHIFGFQADSNPGVQPRWEGRKNLFP